MARVFRLRGGPLDGNEVVVPSTAGREVVVVPLSDTGGCKCGMCKCTPLTRARYRLSEYKGGQVYLYDGMVGETE